MVAVVCVVCVVLSVVTVVGVVVDWVVVGAVVISIRVPFST